ncbi:L,D-transpeptidase family protein [Dehalobacterium formicoaceticum]|uniref:L,D-transpeptidase/peptidoglycan binding protein n=1 Tax=Dehalobacterium formicoaceticum TaxID=51515 RepID=A0ABT1Y3H7_9FIRM|nr:L,D-transpeptidase/peptidoglycan binding protein [Dehalobacterium formicoaceticum]
MSHLDKDLENPAEIPSEELTETPLESEEARAETIPEKIPESSEAEAEAAQPEEENVEHPLKTKIKELVINKRKFLIAGTIILVTFLLVYFGMARYYTQHFYFRTEINGINVSGKTFEEAKMIMAAKVKEYTLNIKERDGKNEQIKAADVGLENIPYEEIKKIFDSQKGFKWVGSFFAGEESHNKTIALKYDEKLLDEMIDQLSCLQPVNIVEPANPTFKYADSTYVIIDGAPGKKVDQEILKSVAADAISKMEAAVDLEARDCYFKPQYDAQSPEIIATNDTLKKYVATKIIYSSGDREKTLDGFRINHWLTVDENLNINVNEEMVWDFINELAQTFNTTGKTRSFVTSPGEKIEVSGGDYGMALDKEQENHYLMSVIPKGENVTKEPLFNQNTFPQGDKDGGNVLEKNPGDLGHNDIGNTYVEISLEKQHIWFYKDGSLIVDGDIVSGNESKNHATRTGVYRLKYKSRNVVLKGPDYAVPVDYWMPFDGGIGIHDATWRSRFGSSIYKTNGSHGCVNTPHHVSKEIFRHIEPGTPVVTY